jgi:autotransporter-associated beta strand protein
MFGNHRFTGRKPFVLSFGIILVLTLISSPVRTQGQTWTGPTSGTNVWTNSGNWSGASIPNATNATVTFTNTAIAEWTNSTVTVGTINFNNSSGSVALGKVALTNDILKLASTSGAPVLNVTNGSTAYIYGILDGTNGFTKSGGGTLAFRFNTKAMLFSGDINLNAGTLTIQQDSSLGNANNDIRVGGNSQLNFGSSSNGTITLGSGRSIALNTGTLTLNTAGNAVSAVINGNISGAGGLIFAGTGTGTNSTSTLNYTLNGTNTFSGASTIQMGSRVSLGAGSALSTNALTIDGNTGTYALLNLGGNTQSVSSFSPVSSNAVARTIVLSNGVLNVGSGGNFTFNGTNNTVLDMSNLTSFTFSGAAASRNFTIQPNTAGGSGNNTNKVHFANAGTGSNSVSANQILIGGANGGSQGANHAAELYLGKSNQMNANSLSLGGFNGTGLMAFQAGTTNGSLTLRGSNGVSRMTELVVGATSSGVRSGAGTLNLAGGTIDALVNTAYIGIFGANSTGPSTSNNLTMGGGTFDALNLTMATITNTTINNASATITAVFQQNGGTAKIGKLTLGDSQTAINTSAPVLNAIYNLSASGATLYASNIAAGTGTNYTSSSVRKINFGAGTIRNYDNNTDLTINGLNTNASGRIEVALSSNANTRTFYADAGRKITVGTNAVLTYNGGFTKDGDGTMEIQSTGNNDTGATVVNDGKLVVNGSIASSSGTTVNSGATLGGSGTVSALTVASGGTLSPGNSPGTLTASSATWNGGGTYVWEINNFLGSAGTNWDFLNVTGGLAISASAGNRFIIDIVSLLASANTTGPADGFDAFANYSFAIATAAGGITGFNSSYFDILTSGFANSMNPEGALAAGAWGIIQDGNSLKLNYTAATAIPEPATGGLLLMGLGIVAAMRRRQRS